MRATKKEEKLILNCFRELYKKSTPSGDFDSLMENATINERGEKEIPMDDYIIDRELFKEIVDKYKNKIKGPEYRKRAFSTTIYLGCSPNEKK
jgi:hypothetical protein